MRRHFKEIFNILNSSSWNVFSKDNGLLCLFFSNRARSWSHYVGNHDKQLQRIQYFRKDQHRRNLGYLRYHEAPGWKTMHHARRSKTHYTCFNYTVNIVIFTRISFSCHLCNLWSLLLCHNRWFSSRFRCRIIALDLGCLSKTDSWSVVLRISHDLLLSRTASVPFFIFPVPHSS